MGKMGTKGQKIYKNFRYFLAAAVFGALVSAYSNCSDINIQATQFQKLSSIAPPEKADLETFGRIDTTCYPNTDALGYAGVQLWPLSPPRNFNFEGQEYPIYVAGNGNCLKDGNNIFDYSGVTTTKGDESILRMRRMFQAVMAFRITTPVVPGYMELLYVGVLSTQPAMAPEMYYSISRKAGDIDPSRPNSDEYCNGYKAAVTSDTGPTKATPPCRLKPGLVYYFNVLDTGVSNMEGYDPPGMDIMFSYSPVECGKSTMIPGYPATYLCP